MSHPAVTEQEQGDGPGQQTDRFRVRRTVNPVPSFLNKVRLGLTGRTQKGEAQRCTLQHLPPEASRA